MGKSKGRELCNNFGFLFGAGRRKESDGISLSSLFIILKF